MKNFSRLAVSALALALIAGCGGDGGDGTTSYTVTPSVSGGRGSINPDKAVSVQSGATAEFTVTPNSDYAIASVGGTCGGTLSGNTYTTKPVTANCTVVASFSQTPPADASIANCFTVPSDIDFDVESLVPTGVPQPANKPVKSSVIRGPFNGQTARVQTVFNADGSSTTDYWNVTSSGVSRLGVAIDGVIYPADPPIIYPANMQPGQYVDRPSNKRDIFVGYEDITLSGKTFSNACHIQSVSLTSDGKVDPKAFPTDSWVAFGYGTIKNYSQGGVGWQYTASAGTPFAKCFEVPKTVRFAWASTVIKGGVYPVESTVGPDTFNDQAAIKSAVTEQYTDGTGATHTLVDTSYMAIKSDGIYEVGHVFSDGRTFTPTPPLFKFPLDMKPGSSIDVVTYDGVGINHIAFVGFETLTLGGKTFPDVCHFHITDNYGGIPSDSWSAYGYGQIQTITQGLSAKYNGDL